jgi:hypothetical protein
LTKGSTYGIIKIQKEKGIDTMKVEIQAIEGNAIIIKGLPSATESRFVSLHAEEIKREEILSKLTERRFIERTINEIVDDIQYASKYGLRKTTVSGFGRTRSMLREVNIEVAKVMEEILNSTILPIFRAQGYNCTPARREYFASGEKYFWTEISW